MGFHGLRDSISERRKARAQRQSEQDPGLDPERSSGVGGGQGGSFKKERVEVQSPGRPKKVRAEDGGAERGPTNTRLRRKGPGGTCTRRAGGHQRL